MTTLATIWTPNKETALAIAGALMDYNFSYSPAPTSTPFGLGHCFDVVAYDELALGRLETFLNEIGRESYIVAGAQFAPNHPIYILSCSTEKGRAVFEIFEDEKRAWETAMGLGLEAPHVATLMTYARRPLTAVNDNDIPF